MFRGATLVFSFSVALDDKITSEWIKKDSFLVILVFAPTTIIVDIIPTLYQALGVKWLTDEVQKEKELKTNKKRRITMTYFHRKSTNLMDTVLFDERLSLNPEERDS